MGVEAEVVPFSVTDNGDFGPVVFENPLGWGSGSSTTWVIFAELNKLCGSKSQRSRGGK